MVPWKLDDDYRIPGSCGVTFGNKIILSIRFCRSFKFLKCKIDKILNFKWSIRPKYPAVAYATPWIVPYKKSSCLTKPGVNTTFLFKLKITLIFFLLQTSYNYVSQDFQSCSLFFTLKYFFSLLLLVKHIPH